MRTLATWRHLAGLLALLLSSCDDRSTATEERRSEADVAKSAVDKRGDSKPPGKTDSVDQRTHSDVAYAHSLSVTSPKASDPFTASVETMESMPPQFALIITEGSFTMKAKLDEIAPPNDEGIIVVKISSNGLNETGLSEAASVRAVLGKLKIGTFKLQLFLATAGKQNHKLSQTFELTAK